MKETTKGILADLKARLREWECLGLPITVSVSSLDSADGEAAFLAVDAAFRCLPALQDLAEAADDYLREMDNPSPCHTMRRQYREKMRAALDKLKPLPEGPGE